MIWIVFIVYIWAGIGYARVIKHLRPLATIKSKHTDLQTAFVSIVIWPAFVFIFVFYEGDKLTTEESL